MAAHGLIHWTELNTRDVAKAKDFYAALFGWTYTTIPMEGGEYGLIMQGETMVGGIFDISSPMFAEMPPHWFTYFACDDIDAKLEAIVAAGGTIIRPPFDVPDTGRIAIIKDPSGAVSGWMTPAPM